MKYKKVFSVLGGGFRTIEVGDDIWAQAPNGVYLQHYEVIAETSRSWMCVRFGLEKHWQDKRCNQTLIPKNMKEWTLGTEYDFNEQLWADKNCYNISSAVEGCRRDPKKLRAIARIVGYDK